MAAVSVKRSIGPPKLSHSVTAQVQVHLFTLIQLQYNNYKEKNKGEI